MTVAEIIADAAVGAGRDEIEIVDSLTVEGVVVVVYDRTADYKDIGAGVVKERRVLVRPERGGGTDVIAQTEQVA